jgi:hypothetical protein
MVAAETRMTKRQHAGPGATPGKTDAQIDQEFASLRSQVAADYRNAVLAAARGDFDGSEVIKAICLAGKSPSDFEKDLQRVRARRDALAGMREASEIEAGVPELEDYRKAAARSEVDALRADSLAVLRRTARPAAIRRLQEIDVQILPISNECYAIAAPEDWKIQRCHLVAQAAAEKHHQPELEGRIGRGDRQQARRVELLEKIAALNAERAELETEVITGADWFGGT